jgi:predicted DNA-binding protein YlxM (UPF0122 family)
MTKRGPKPGQKRLHSVKSLAEIASELHVSERTVAVDYKNAVKKLKQIPGAFELLTYVVCRLVEDDKDLLQANSVECNPAFAELFSDGGEKE